MARPTPLLTLSLLLVVLLAASAARAALLRSATCDALEAYMRSNALSRVGPYGFFRPFPRNVLFSSQPEISQARAPTAAAAAPVAGVDFSETNVQVDGVDEPDIVKTDGVNVYSIREKTLYITAVGAGGAAGKLRGSLKFPTFTNDILLDGASLLVISSDYGRLDPTPAPTPGPGGPPILLPLAAAGEPIERQAGSSFVSFPIIRNDGGPIVVLYRVSVLQGRPRLVQTLRIEGSYVSGREVSGVARIVVRTDPTRKLPFVSPRSDLSEKEATEINKEIVRNVTSDSWLPAYRLENARCAKGKKSTNRSAKCVSRGFVASCKRIFLPTGKTFAGFDLLSVLTVRLKGSLKPRGGVSVVSGSGEIYATATSLYVTTLPYRGDFPFGSPRWGPSFTTNVHKFALSQSSATYVASGTVKGSVLNQFAMHEWQGTFFIATTEGAPWWGGRDLSASKVTAMKVRGSKLATVGEVGNLGVGERIYSVRYIASTAYVVTFRQVDPLYIVDLAKPSALRVTGELKIPGYSSYLHLISPGRILGVGQEATAQGRTTGAKVTLFDVSDVTKPEELAVWSLNDSSSPVDWDHRAFLYWAPERIAVLPVSVYSGRGSEEFVGAVVLEVGDEELKERGRISHPKCCGKPGYTPTVQRNFVVGKVHLWSLSTERLQINDIKSLKVEGGIALKA